MTVLPLSSVTAMMSLYLSHSFMYIMGYAVLTLPPLKIKFLTHEKNSLLRMYVIKNYPFIHPIFIRKCDLLDDAMHLAFSNRRALNRLGVCMFFLQLLNWSVCALNMTDLIFPSSFCRIAIF